MYSYDARYFQSISLFSLYIKCPFGQEAAGCPFSDIRNCHCLEDKFQLAEKCALDADGFNRMWAYHNACYLQRLQAALIPPPGTKSPSQGKKAQLCL